MVNQSADAEDPSDLHVDVFTHSSTGFPGAWAEEEISTLLDVWEEALDARLQSSGKPFSTLDKVLDSLANVGFREVDRNDVIKQMNTLRTEYRVYLGLVKIGIPTVKANCVPQLQRILRKASTRRGRRRRISTASNQMDGETDNSVKLQPGSTEETTGTKRVRFQRQTLQNSIQTAIDQQKTIMEYLQNVFNKIQESHSQMISLLEELVTLQKKQSRLN